MSVSQQASLVYTGSTSAAIDSIGETESFTINLDAHQRLTIVADTNSALAPTLTLYDPSNVALATTTAASGHDVLLQSIDVATDGTYTIQVAGDGSTLGAFSLRVYLNAAVENDQTIGAPSNVSPASAQSLDGGFISIGGGAAYNSVVGRGPAATTTFSASETKNDNIYYPNVLNYSFASAPAPTGDATLKLTAFADLDASTEYLTVSAEGLFQRDVFVTGGLQQQLVTTAVTIPSAVAQQLASDGVISVTVTPTSAVGNLGTNYLTLDLSYPYISTASAPGGWFSFSLADGESVSLALNDAPAGALKLYGADGSTLLAKGLGADNRHLTISGFVDTTTDSAPTTYYAFVDTSSAYELQILKQSLIEIEPNNDSGPGSQNVASSGAVFGEVTSGVTMPTGVGTPIVGPFDITSTPLSLGFATDGSFIGSSIGARHNGVEYLRYGTFLATYAVGINGVAYSNGSPSNSTAFPVTMENLSIGAQRMIRVRGNVISGVAFERVVTWRDGDDYATILSRLTNNTIGTLNSVTLLENHDPDPAGSYSTSNDVIAGGDLVVGSNSFGAMGLGSADPRAVLSAEGFYISDPLEIINSPVDPNGISDDIAINLAFNLGALAPGASTTAAMVMVFGANQAAVEAKYTQVVSATTVGDKDTYAIPAQAGDALNLSVNVPATGPGEFVNSLQPIIELFDPAGTLVASSTTGTLSYAALTTGNYAASVRAAGTTKGEYFLAVTGYSGGLSPFRVLSSTPADGSAQVNAPTEFTTDLSNTVLLSSVDAADLFVDGVPATSVTIIDENTLRFGLPALADGTHTFSLAAGAMTDLHGQTSQAYTATISIDSHGPRIIASSILQNDQIEPGTLTYLVQFDEVLDTSSLDASDVTLTGLLTGFRSPTTFHYEATTSTLTLKYANLPEDDYTFTLVSAVTGLRDRAGNLLDGERNASTTVPSGNGVNGGNFNLSFTVENVNGAFPTPFIPAPPLGSLIYTSSVTGRISSATDQDQFTVNLDAGQRLSLLIDPVFQASVTLLGPGLTPLATADAAASGEKLLLQSVPIDVAGLYTVQIKSLGGTIGSYTINAALNAQLEREQQLGSPNNSPANAEDLDPAFLNLGSGVAQYAGVLGHTTGATSGVLFQETFPTTSFDPTKWSLTTNAGIDGVGLGEPSEPYSARLNGSPSGGDVIQSAIVNLAGQTSATLTYWFEQTGGGETVDSGEDLILWYQNAAGTWIELERQLGSGPNMTAYQSRTVTLPATALHANFRFRFTNIGTSGAFDDWFVDNISVSGSSVNPDSGDWYKFSLTDGQSVSVAALGDAGTISIDLYDETGSVKLASGASASEWTQAVQNFVDLTSDGVANTYYVQVKGSAQDYRLSIARESDLDLEPNNSIDGAQDITGINNALGHIIDGGEDWYQIAVNSGDAIAISTTAPGSGPYEFVNAMGQGVPGGLIISEIVDGAVGDGNPKFVELTNTGIAPFTFSAGGLIVQSNSSVDQVVDIDLSGVTILPGESFVIAAVANNGQAVFESTYGFAADLYTENLGDGNDRVILTNTADGSHILDIYGELGVNGTGESWEYTDSYAFRTPFAVTPSGVVFASGGWHIAGVDALETGDDVSEAARLLALTTPGTHDFVAGDTPFVRVALFDPSGALVEPSASSIHHTATQSGIYKLRVTSVDLAGEYFVAVNGATGISDAPRVIATTPPTGTLSNQFPTTYSLTFSEALRDGSLTAGDLLINGTQAASAVTRTGPNSYTFDLKPATNTGSGTYTVQLATGAVVDLQGISNAAFSATIEFDITPPIITNLLFNSAPLPLGGVQAGPLTIQASFSEDLREEVVSGQLGVEDVTLVNQLTGDVIAAISLAYDSALNRVVVAFPAVDEGLFALTLISGNGAFEDIAGNDLDGEPYGASLVGTPSGNGTPGGNYTLTFAVDALGPRLVQEMDRLRPLGSYMAISEHNVGVTSSPGDVDDYQIYVEAGQSLSAVVTPASPNAKMFVSLVGLSGPVASPVRGGSAVLPATLVPVTGPLTLRVFGDATTSYTIDVYANAETEKLVGDSANGQELSLDSSRISVGANRWGAVGAIADNPSLSTVYTQDFNLSAGSFVLNNTTFGAGNGLWHRSTGRQADGLADHSPAGSLYFGKAEGPLGGGNFDTGTATGGTATSPSIAVPSASVVKLGLNYLLATDGILGRDVAEIVVTGSISGSVVVASTANGSLQSNTGGVWKPLTLDISQFANQNITIQFRFDSVNAQANGNEGWYIDDVRLQAANSYLADLDEYTLNLTPYLGKPINFYVASQLNNSISGASVTLLGPDGTSLVATATSNPLAVSATNFEQAILGFVPTVPGVYTLRVISDKPGDYGVLVTESLPFEIEPNDAVSSNLLPLGGANSVLGFGSVNDRGASSSSRLFTIAASTREIVEINPASGAEVHRIPVPGAASLGGPDGLAFNGSSLFYSTASSYGGGTLYELDPNTGAILDSDTLASIGASVTLDGLGAVSGLIFTADYSSNRVYFIDPRTDTLVGSWVAPVDIVGGATGAGSRGSVFLTTSGGGIVELAANTGQLVRNVTSPSTVLYGLAYVNGDLYAGSSSGGIYRLNPDSGAVLSTFSPGYPIYSLGGDDSSGSVSLVSLAHSASSLATESLPTADDPDVYVSPQYSTLEIDDTGFAKDDPLASVVGAELAILALSADAATGAALPAFTAGAMDLVQVYGDYVVIDAVASNDSGELLNNLLGLGLINGSAYGRIVSGWLPITAITEMAALTSLRFAQPAYKPLTSIGLTTSQADAAMQADVGRSLYSVDGTGVTVGVLSDSYDRGPGSASADIASGDLPGVANRLGHITPVRVLADASGSDEGRAMLQLVHDVAPGAGLAFHTAVNGQADFASGIIELQTVAGANVIVDDVIYFAEPMFQDGIIAQAIDTVVGNGATYFSSAGNNARASWEGAYRPSGVLLSGRQLHDFDPGPGIDTYQSITVPSGTTLRFSFQWDSPFYSVSGGSGSSNDVDFYVLNSTGTTILASGTTSNVGGDALEVVSYTNTSGSTQLNIAIGLSRGTAPGLMKWVGFGRPTVNEYATNSATAYGHANAAGAMAVGAADYRDTPEFGTNPPEIEYFSSAGGIPILFTKTGTPTNDLRIKPQITAPDGTNTTFFGSDADGDGYPNFFGTSAAAPHAAAVAALMQQIAPTATPNEIYNAMMNSAIDMDDPSTPAFDVGFDWGTGYGLLQADAALTLIHVDPALVGPRVTNTTPGAGVTHDLSITELQLAFSEDISPTSAVDVANYSLIRAGANGVFEGGLGDDIVLALTPVFDGHAAITLTIGDGTTPLGFGKYRLTVNGHSSIEDLDGNPLNSTTGIGGGSDFVQDFEVQFAIPGGGDFYQINLVRGQQVEVTPSSLWTDPLNSLLNDLDTQIIVYDDRGTPLIIESGSIGAAPVATFVATTDGPYFIQVIAEAGEGEYRLDAEIKNVTLVGDYNQDWSVDMSDYVVWRNSLGQSTSPYTLADGDGDGVVTNNDYPVWRSAFGTTLATATPAQLRTLLSTGSVVVAADLGMPVEMEVAPVESVVVQPASSTLLAAANIDLHEPSGNGSNDGLALMRAALETMDSSTLAGNAADIEHISAQRVAGTNSAQDLLGILALADSHIASHSGRRTATDGDYSPAARADAVDGYFSELGNAWTAVQSRITPTRLRQPS